MIPRDGEDTEASPLDQMPGHAEHAKPPRESRVRAAARGRRRQSKYLGAAPGCKLTLRHGLQERERQESPSHWLWGLKRTYGDWSYPPPEIRLCGSTCMSNDGRRNRQGRGGFLELLLEAEVGVLTEAAGAMRIRMELEELAGSEQAPPRFLVSVASERLKAAPKWF